MTPRFDGESVHDYQHRLFDVRFAAYNEAPVSTAVDRYRKRELGKRAWWTLTGHLMGVHGSKWPTIGKTFDQAIAHHNELHKP